jgi:hypothetical protein
MDAVLTTSSPKLPLADAFFAGAITSGSLAHAYVLKGKTSAALYNLALQVAQVINCKNRPAASTSGVLQLDALACGHCTDCRWVTQNSHPAVLTVSRFTYQVNDKKERPELLSPDELEKIAQKATWPTLIKTDQMGLLIQQLGISSEYNRVVIFTDAEELPASMPSDVAPPFDWRGLEATADRSFHIRPLTRHTFNASSVNKFLKTLEEPPPRTLFFFIAETEEQLLETIVSRCQVVPGIAVGGELTSPQVLNAYRQFLTDLYRRLGQQGDVYMLAGEFEDFFTQQHGLNLSQALDVLQLDLRQRFFEVEWQEPQFAAYRAIQHDLDKALRMLASKTNEGQSILELFLSLQSNISALPFS